MRVATTALILTAVIVASGCKPAVQPQNPSPFEQDDPHAEDAARQAPAAVAASKPATPPIVGNVERARLNAVLDAGIGSLLAGIEVNPRLDLRERFIGWEVVRFAYKWADIRPGDVILHINDRAIGKPNEVQELWDSLRSADQIIVRGERGEGNLELRFDIVGDAP